MEGIDIYSKYNAGEFNMNINAEDTEKEKSVVVEAVVEAEEVACEPGQFCVKNSQGVSINGVGFCKGKYEIGQLVGNLTINEDLKSTILSLDSAAIRTNKHLAG